MIPPAAAIRARMTTGSSLKSCSRGRSSSLRLNLFRCLGASGLAAGQSGRFSRWERWFRLVQAYFTRKRPMVRGFGAAIAAGAGGRSQTRRGRAFSEPRSERRCKARIAQADRSDFCFRLRYAESVYRRGIMDGPSTSCRTVSWFLSGRKLGRGKIIENQTEAKVTLAVDDRGPPDQVGEAVSGVRVSNPIRIVFRSRRTYQKSVDSRRRRFETHDQVGL